MKFHWLFISCVFLTACNDSESIMTNKTAPIEVALHAPIRDILSNSTTAFSQECMSDLGLCWYKIDKSANDKNLPEAVVKNATSTLNLPQVTNITIVVDEQVGSNVENIDITLRGLPDNSTHDQYRTFIYKLIKSIKSSGWEHYYFVEDPRISGSQAGKIDSPQYVLGHHVSSHPWLDPDYPIDIDRWLKISSFYNWYFYNDGAYLNLKAWRHDSKDNPTETGTYLITLEFQSEMEFWKSGITNEKDRLHWKELLPARLNDYHEARLTIEKKARDAGIEIDDSYQDPPIHALK